MDSFNVKQIAEMLHTNEETVRRWIRKGKLKADQASRKEGNLVSEEALVSFLQSSSKYMKYIDTSSLATSAATISAAMLSYLFIQNRVNDSNARKALVPAESIIALLNADIISREASIKLKKDTVEQLGKEIQEEEAYITESKRIIDNLAQKMKDKLPEETIE